MKPKKLYTGNTLTEENFNNIIEKLRGLENSELDLGDIEHRFEEGDDLAGSRVSFTRNEYGEISSFAVSILEKTDRTPFSSIDGLVFENGEISDVLTSSDYQVLRKSDGSLIDRSGISLSSSGVITFTSIHDELEVLVNGLEYRDTKTYFIGRDRTTREITRISMLPLEDTVELEEKLLHPLVIHSNTGDVVEILDVNKNVLSGTHYVDLFHRHWTTSTGDDVADFILDFKEELIMKRVAFDYSLHNNGYVSVDIWGSKDGNHWTRLKRLRDIKNADKIDGSFREDFDTVGAFRYLKFNTTHVYTSGTDRFRRLEIYGYHPENRDLMTEQKLGNRTFIAGEENSGTAYNDKVTVITNIPKLNRENETDLYTPTDILSYTSNNFRSVRNGDYIQFNFNEPEEIKRLRFKTNSISEWKFEASQDGTDWFELAHIFPSQENFLNNVLLDKPVKVKYYRIVIINKANNFPRIQTPLFLE